MPIVSPANSIDSLAANAAALAEAASLAIRIEPQLLRKLRLELFPSFDAGVEADLWFSAVVETRTPSGIVLHASAREILRQRLGMKNVVLEAAWTIVQSVHRDLSPALFAEEKLAYLTLAEKHEEARDLLRSVVATLVSPRGRGLAGWAAQAANRVPHAARPLEEAQMLALGASLRLGEAAPRQSGISSARASEWAAWLAPDDLETLPFGVALLEDAVEFGPVGRPSSHRLLLPKTNPVVVEVGWHDGAIDRMERVPLNPNGVTLVEFGPGVTEVELRTVLGDSYWLTVPAPRERDSIKKRLSRARPPRVQLTYDIQTGDAIERKDIPFIVAVLADLSGSKPSGAKPLKDRKLIEINLDNFAAVMGVFKPRVTVFVSNPRMGRQNFSAELEFLSLDDFGPSAVARQIESTRERLEKRTLLATVAAMIDEDQALASKLNGYIHRAEPSSSNETGPSATLLSILVETIVEANAETNKRSLNQPVEYAKALMDALRDPVSFRSVEEAISRSMKSLDKELSDWINPLLHNPAFQTLEATWRGLNYLVQQTEAGQQLKILVWDVSKSELARESARATEFDQTAVFRKLYEEQFGVYHGEPISLIVGAYEFGRVPEDVALLRHIASVAAACHAPFVAAASAQMFNLEKLTDLNSPRDLAKLFDSIDAAAWRDLRQSEEARYLALTIPHILLRLPYGKESAPVEEFGFQEDIDASDRSTFLWGNAAFAFAARVTEAFAKYAWPASIRGVEGGGLVEGLPVHNFTNDYGEAILNSPTDAAITDRREMELASEGFIPLCFTKGYSAAAFFSARSIHKPRVYESRDHDLKAVAQLSLQLPYLLVASRFALYLKCMMRDRIGSFMSRDSSEYFLNQWIADYVQEKPEPSQEAKARRPLQSARIEVQEVQGRPGSYRAVLFIRPDFQLEPLPADMRVIIDLPSPYGSTFAQ